MSADVFTAWLHHGDATGGFDTDLLLLCDAEALVDEAVALGAKIAALGRPSATMCKEAVNAAYELSLAEGLRLERRLFRLDFLSTEWKCDF